MIGEARFEHIVELGSERWTPRGDAETRLRSSLAQALRHNDVLDLILFGSIARRSTTGFSDVDAILVISDDTMMGGQRLAKLRGRILEAQRAVLRYQPMQHHGFLVVPVSLLSHATHALSLPPEAVHTTVSLFGRDLQLRFTGFQALAVRRLSDLCRAVIRLESWPTHPWNVHRAVSMFALIPSLYMQAVGRPCAKHESFELARQEFGSIWAPYDVLARVREVWRRERRPLLELTAMGVRNPWTAVAAFRRLPVAVPKPIRRGLDDPCLCGLQELARRMLAGTT
ncbi:hypothetical protein BH18ACT13_BH18ACT13_01770 [soil metagenome]